MEKIKKGFKASNSFKINNFDLIRLIAAAQVVVVHGITHLEVKNLAYLLPYLNAFPGVPVFFFLSGFLISAAWERNSDLKSFFTNRIVRIFPGLWFCVIFSLISILIFGSIKGLNIPISQLILWAFMQGTFLPQWNPDFLNWFGVGVVNGSLWTIPVELSFYILMPLVYVSASRVKIKLNSLLIVLTSISFILFYMLIMFDPLNASGLIIKKLLGFTPLPWIGMFFLGTLSQRYIHTLHPIIANNAFLFFIIFVSTNLIGTNIEIDILFGSANDIGILNYFALCLFVLSMGYTYPLTADKLLKRNDISYGIYIYHMIVFNSLLMMGIINNIGFILGILITIILALLSWLAIEKPSLRKRKTYLYKR